MLHKTKLLFLQHGCIEAYLKEIGLLRTEWIHVADDTFWVDLVSFGTTILYTALQQVLFCAY